ncbi:MAG: AMIN domain-containing protein, partial [Gammaproteobacteria bacterium]
MDRYLSKLGLGAAALLLSATAIADNVQIDKVRIAHSDQRTRIVLDLDRSAEHKLFTLSNPNRVVVDLASGRFAAGKI